MQNGGRVSKHKKQHFIPVSYLQAWVDQTTPKGHTPYTWIFNKDGSEPRQKAPVNVFWESGMYTITKADGERDLVLEHGLAQLESWFAKIREQNIMCQLSLDETEHMQVCAFIAAMTARTKLFRDHQKSQWGNVLEHMECLIKWAETATDEEKMQAVSMSSSSDRSMGYEEVKSLAENPLQDILPQLIDELTPLLYKLDFCVLTTMDSIGFITSDHPCVWFDPEAYKRPPLFRSPALIYESIEIYLPVSPMQCISLNRRGITGYLAINESIVNDVNRMTRFYAGEYFVVRKNEKRDVWFDPGEEPADSWEKVQGGSVYDEDNPL